MLASGSAIASSCRRRAAFAFTFFVLSSAGTFEPSRSSAQSTATPPSTSSPTANRETTQYTPLLLGKHPARTRGVRRADVLTDGRAAIEGGAWKTRLTAQLDDAASFVEYDLGTAQHVNAAWLQGDNNDVYRIEGSLDGHSFSRLWDAEPVARSGLRARSTRSLDAEARYVRIRAMRGDGTFTISEVQLFSGRGADLPLPAAVNAIPLSERLRDRTLLFGLSLVALLCVPARSRRWLLGAALALAAVATARFAAGVWEDMPIDAREVSLVRGTVAFVGAIAVAREVFSPARWPASRICVSVLALCAALGIGAFYNLGQPQFWNEHQGRWSFAHMLDLRQYYPTAKYFRELSYSRLYDADLATYQEQTPDHSLASLARQSVRDLQTFQVGSVADRSAEIASIRSRFSPERWAAYRADAEWFRRSMGDEQYLEGLNDYGGNATPVWMAIAHVLFSLVAPGDRAFTATGLLDLALMGAAFIAIWRTFGLRTMLASALVFGANDFVMYGTNWSGATLRHDWLAYLAFSLCALRRERWVEAGVWLGLATMIRAFPILALAGAALPALLRVSTGIARTRRLPRLSELVKQERAILRVAGGALVTALISAALATWILGPTSWVDWWLKVAKIESDPHPACVALRNLIAGSEDQARVLRARWPLYAALMLLYSSAVLWLSRNARMERAAVLGLCLVPVLLYPANYYLHFVYLIPLLAVPRDGASGRLGPRDGFIWVIMLLMCASQYFTTLEREFALHFYLSTVTLFAALTAVFAVLLAYDEDLRAWLARPPGG